MTLHAPLEGRVRYIVGLQTKKILLFLVEGIYEVITLSGAIKGFIKKVLNNNVEFSMFNCDITADNNSKPSSIKEKVYSKVNDFIKENKLRKTDILGIVHLVDTDAV